jgi:hypothetical protein
VQDFGDIGIYLKNKRKKLAIQREQFLEDDDEERPMVFDKVSIYVRRRRRVVRATHS